MSDRLIVDVRMVLLRHGYPKLTRVDRDTLHLALVRIVYGRRSSTGRVAGVDLNVMEPPDETPAHGHYPTADEVDEGKDNWGAGNQGDGGKYDGGFHLTHMVEAQRGMSGLEIEIFLATGKKPDLSLPPLEERMVAETDDDAVMSPAEAAAWLSGGPLPPAAARMGNQQSRVEPLTAGDS